MKYMLIITFLFFLSSSYTNCALLRNTPVKSKKIIKLDLTPLNAKSGRLTNVAPEATNLVTANLASPRAEIHLNINHQGIVQKTERIATTPVLGEKRVFDPKTKEWSTQPAVINHRIYATTTKVANMNTYHTVHIDLLTGNAIPKTGLKPKGTFGTR